MGFIKLLLILAAISVPICGAICLIVLLGLGWKGGAKYWITTCALVPILLCAFGAYVILSFLLPPPSEIFDPQGPDPGPLNFAVAFTVGVIAPFAYLGIAIPLSFAMIRIFCR